MVVWGFRLVGLPARESREQVGNMVCFQWLERRLAEGLLVGCTSLWLSVRLQIAEQAFQPALVAVMIFPGCEISNVACPFDMCGPIGGTLHHLLIQADEKEHSALHLAFFGKCLLDLVFDHQLATEYTESTSRSLSYRRMDSSMRCLNLSPIFISSGANQQRTPLLCRSA